MVAVQSRMARAATGLTLLQIAAKAKVATTTIVRFERGEELKPRTIEAIQRVYESAGIEFTNGAAPGVRVHAQPKTTKRK